MTRGKLLTMLVLVMVICLGLAALLAPVSAERAVEPVRLVPFSPSEVAEVAVETGGAVARLVRGAPDRWHIVPAGGEATAGATWPASMERVRGFLRILDRLRAGPADTGPSDAPASWVRITSVDGEIVSIGLPATSLGARSIVRFIGPGESGEGRALVTTDELSRMLAGPGIMNWIDARPFAAVAGEVLEISVVSAGAEMRMVRAGAGWRIASPFGAPAERALVQELLESLRTLPFSSPLPGLPDEGSASTTITLSAESKAVAADGSVSSAPTVHTLALLGPATSGGLMRASVRAESVTPGLAGVIAGPLSVELDSERLASYVRQPAFYISRKALDAAPGDIRGFGLARGEAERRWERSDRGWSEGGDAMPAEAAAALDGLAILLSETPAAVAAWTGEEDPPHADKLAEIECLGLGGATIARVGLAFGPLPNAGAEGRVHAILLHDGVARYYTRESTVAVLGWLLGARSQQ